MPENIRQKLRRFCSYIKENKPASWRYALEQLQMIEEYVEQNPDASSHFDKLKKNLFGKENKDEGSSSKQSEGAKQATRQVERYPDQEVNIPPLKIINAGQANFKYPDEAFSQISGPLQGSHSGS